MIHINPYSDWKTKMASQLPVAARKRAANFILDNGNNLQRKRFSFHFDDDFDTDPSVEVNKALAHYQNADGGFGHGLEQDLRTKNSSVICTTIALQIFEETEAPSTTPAIAAAMSFLDNQYKFNNWTTIDKNCNDAPHAPWWKYNENWAGIDRFLANPGAEIISYQLRYGSNLPPPVQNDLLHRALEHLGQHELEMHELLSYVRLYHCGYLSSHYREAMLPSLLNQSYQLVKVNPSDWEEYGLTPIDLVKSPQSIFHEFFGESLIANFDYQIDQQSEEGCWVPRWSWGGAFPETWQLVETEIKVELTLKFLIQLKRFNYLENE
jgi:hypothetical protein